MAIAAPPPPHITLMPSPLRPDRLTAREPPQPSSTSSPPPQRRRRRRRRRSCQRPPWHRHRREHHIRHLQNHRQPHVDWRWLPTCRTSALVRKSRTATATTWRPTTVHRSTPSTPTLPSSRLRPLLRFALCLALMLTASASLPLSHAECPRQCECKWKSGKESADCSSKNLTTLPPHFDAGTQVLDLANNEIDAIRADAFTHVNLLNLQKLSVARCRIQTIDRFGFRKIKNLVELDLSDNVLRAVPTHAFDSTPELRELRLSGNPLHVLGAEAFGNVPLVRLELNKCRLEQIESGAFAGLHTSLEILWMDENRLRTVEAETFTVLQTLHDLKLAGNPWNCSCALRPLRRWMLREKITVGVPECAAPERLAGRPWDKLDLDDFACRPQIEAAGGRDQIQAVEGSNVTITCALRAVPEAQVHWYLRGRLLANLSAAIPVTVTHGRKVFIARWWPEESNLTIVNADVQDAGAYNCTAANNAGRSEASVSLQISRRPPEPIVGWRVLLTGMVATAMILIAAALLGVFVCTTRKGGERRLLRWKKRRRTESCENIEMTFSAGGKRLDNGGGPKPYGENGISVVGQTQKNRYRSVPSDDEGSLYEESGGLAAVGTIAASMGGASSAAAARPPPDVHVSRLIDFCDQIPTSANASLDGCPFDPNKSEYSSPSKTPMLLYTKPNWTQQQQLLQHQQQQMQQPPSIDLSQTNAGSNADTAVYSSFDRRHHRSRPSAKAATNHCDTTDSTYPDLLDISSLSINTKLRANTQAVAVAMAQQQQQQQPAASTEPPFSTYPRQKPSPARTKTAALAAAAAAAHFSDSQSYLLASSSNSHLLSNLSINMKQPQQHLQQPLPAQRHSAIYNNHGGSMLPDDNHAAMQLLDFGPQQQQQQKQHNAIAAAAAALINNNPPPSSSVLDSPSSPSSSSTAAATSIIATAQAYDYHAAQLERFLEEYRNLQQQLCRMKETCDSIRQKEAPLHRLGDRSSAQMADPAMYTSAAAVAASAVASSGGFEGRDDAALVAAASALAGGLPLDEAGSPNHRALMRKTTVSARQPPDPPPYWLHRTAILKRLQAQPSGGGVGAVVGAGGVVGAGTGGGGSGAPAAVVDNGNELKDYFRPQS